MSLYDETKYFVTHDHLWYLNRQTARTFWFRVEMIFEAKFLVASINDLESI